MGCIFGRRRNQTIHLRTAAACIIFVVAVVLTQPDSVRAQLDQRVPIDQLFRQFGQHLGTPQSLASRPSFDCSRVRNSVAQVICADREGATADWDLNAAVWATEHIVGEAGLSAFQKEQENWRSALPRQCRLPQTFSDAIPRRDSQCVIDAFKERSRTLRRSLPPEALAEAKLSPDQRASIQQELIAFGFLSGPPDGEFGPITREAIRRFQIANGMPATGFFRSGKSNDTISENRAATDRTPPPQGSNQRVEQEIQATQVEPQVRQHRWESPGPLAFPSQPADHVQPPTRQAQQDVARPVLDSVLAGANINTQSRSYGQLQSDQPPATRPATASQSGETPALPLWVLVTLLAVTAGVTLIFFFRLEPSQPGKKLDLRSARVVAFDGDGNPIQGFNEGVIARLLGHDLTLSSPSSNQSICYSLKHDVRCLRILDEKQQIAVGRTLTRMAFTGAAWSLTRARNRRDVGIGSALLDLRYFGTEKRKLADIEILFTDMSTVVLQCDEATFKQIIDQTGGDVTSKRAIKEAQLAESLLQRMVKDGARGLPELKKRIEQTEASIEELLSKAENGASFEERDSANQQAHRLKRELAIPKAAYFDIA